MYEWLPYNGRYLEEVPADDAERRAWLRQQLDPRLRRAADLYRDQLLGRYGPDKGGQVRYVEAFEVCEYGSPLTEENQKQLFPFFE
jgi:hypothetical protein